jgi:peptide/nickel transport system permease protein
MADRWAHTIAAIQDEQFMPLLASHEGGPDDDWPPSPPLQGVHLQKQANKSPMILGVGGAATIMRLQRTTMLEVLRSDFVRTARAKGLWEQVVIVRHAMKNAMLPVITVIGLEFAFLIGGLVVTEQVFNLNGLGKLFVQSIAQRDYTMTQTLVMLVAVTFVLVNFVIDILYAWLDPRIHYQ